MMMEHIVEEIDEKIRGVCYSLLSLVSDSERGI